MPITPGPWYVHEQTDICAVANQELLATAYRMSKSKTAARCNARLIAAAPDLLQAAKDAMQALDEGSTYQGEVLEVIAALREAIWRVEGK